MITITGKSVFGGVSIGKLSFYKRNQKVIKFHKILQVNFIGEDELNLYYEYDRDTFNKTKVKMEAMLLPINEE